MNVRINVSVCVRWWAWIIPCFPKPVIQCNTLNKQFLNNSSVMYLTCIVHYNVMKYTA